MQESEQLRLLGVTVYSFALGTQLLASQSDWLLSLRLDDCSKQDRLAFLCGWDALDFEAVVV